MVVKGSSISSSLIKSANDGGSGSGGVIRILGIPDPIPDPIIDPLDVTVDAGGKGTRNSGELEFI